MTKFVAGVVVVILLIVAFSFLERESEKDIEEKRKNMGPQELDEDEFE